VEVLFAFHGEPGHVVEVCGDLPDWTRPAVMTETTPGRYERTLRLAPGIYRYKLRIDGQRWVVDPAAAAVDRAEGFENGLAIVGGSRPPLFFAPDAAHLHRDARGVIAIHAEHEASLAPPRGVRISAAAGEGAVEIEAPLQEVGARGGVVLLRAEARLPASCAAAQGSASFAGCDGEPFPLPPPPDALDEAPEWARGAVFYAVFVDRWRRHPASPPDVRSSPRGARSTADTLYGGDLDGIRASLGSIADLGATAIVLTPVHVAESPHRYDATDLHTVDPRLGGEAALARLTEAASRRGLRVIVDAAFTHVHEAHPAFQDLLQNQERSRFARWFKVRRFPVRARDTGSFAAYYGHPHLPLLDLGDAGARAHVIEAARRLIALGAGGLRLDAMEEAPDDFWAELRRAGRALDPSLLLLGEVVGDRPARFLGRGGADLATDFGERERMIAFFARGALSARHFWEEGLLHAHRAGPRGPSSRLIFLDNHDTARFRSIAVQHDRLRLALVHLLTRPEPAWITYGTELGMAGGATDARREDVWADRLPMPPDDPPTRTRALLAALGRLRRSVPALRSPRTRLHEARGGLLVVDRGGEEGAPAARVCLNAGERPAEIPALPAGARPLLDTDGEGAPAGRPLGAWSGRIVLVPDDVASG
jgi:glycosidase